MEAIKACAGENIEAAVLYPEDERYLIGGESSVTHYEVVDQLCRLGSQDSNLILKDQNLLCCQLHHSPRSAPEDRPSASRRYAA